MQSHLQFKFVKSACIPPDSAAIGSSDILGQVVQKHPVRTERTRTHVRDRDRDRDRLRIVIHHRKLFKNEIQQPNNYKRYLGVFKKL